MPIAQNGRGAQRVIYVDEQGVEHIILLAMLGDSIAWDGHVHQSLQIPVAKAFASAFSPAVLAGVNMSPPVAEAFAEMPTVVVSASSTASPFAATAAARMWVPIVNAGHNIVVPAATAAAEMWAPELNVVFGVIAPTMTADAVMQIPQIIADANLGMALGEAYAVMHGPTVGSYAFVSVPAATASALMQVPAVHADVNLAAARATATSKMWVPGVLAGVTVSPAAATATAVFQLPEIRTSLFTRQRINKSGTTPQFAYTAVPGWVSDATYSGTVNPTNNGMTVIGSGVKAYVRASLTTNIPVTGTAELRINGAAHGPDWWTGSSTAYGQYSIDLTSGDELTIRTTQSTTNTTLITGGLIEVMPAVGTPTFDAAVSAWNGSSDIAATLTTTAAETTVFISLDCSLKNAPRVDGVSTTLVSGTVRDTRQVWCLSGVVAGSHSVTAETSLSGGSMVAASYSGITAIGVGNTGSNAFSSTMAMTAAGGAGQLCLYSFHGSGMGDAGSTSTGTIRGKVKNTDYSNKSIMLADSTSANVSATVGSGTSLSASAVWLY